MPSVTHSDLTPYVTLLLLRAPTASKQKQSVAKLLEEIEQFVESLEDGATRKSVVRSTPDTKDGMTTGYLHFTERRRPSWLSKNAAAKLEDFVHHVIVVAQAKDLVAICASESAYQGEIARIATSGDGSYPAIEDLAHLPAELLNAAFVGGQARTLWLSGLHRPTPVKADAKILSGPDLVSALNPLGDQSYTFSAVRCSVTGGDLARSTIGVTPRKSRVWSGTSASYDDFRAQAGGILRHLHKIDKAGSLVASPIPYLAVAVNDPMGIERAYDLAVIAPELLSDDHTLKPEERALAEKYALRTRFDVTGAGGPDCEVAAHIDGIPSGRFRIALSFGADGRVSPKVTPVGKPMRSLTATEREVSRVLARRDWVSIYYESGHTISRGTCFRPQYRDQRFDAWSWRSFAGYEVHREKPMNGDSVAFDDIGIRTSLFCFTYKGWSLPNAASGSPGACVWLACDDGANEVADFIRFECDGGIRPRLTLIHVKGSHSELATRGMSVSAYEVVVAQAVKNIRALTLETLLDLLERGGSNATKRFAWRNGKPQADRQGMIAAIDGMGGDLDREVVIVQPSTRRSEYFRALPTSKGKKAAAIPGWYHRRAQLDTLLISAQAACFEVGARLTVVADDT